MTKLVSFEYKTSEYLLNKKNKLCNRLMYKILRYIRFSCLF